jgi:hypothetical protein
MTRRTRNTIVLALLSVGLLAAATLAAVQPDTTADAVDAIDLPTVEVENRDLVLEHETVGRLTPASSLDVVSPTAGTVVDIASAGSTLSTGSVLAVVDDEPVVVLNGEIPSWRDLGVGDEGADVEQLESALVSAGFDPDQMVTVDEEYTTATATMVEAWQETIGAEPTGDISRIAVVYVADAMRVEFVESPMGAVVASGDLLLELASVERVAVTEVPVADTADLATGASIAVRLPDRTMLDGTVRSVTVAADASVRTVVVAIADAQSDSSQTDSLAGLGDVEIDLLWSVSVADDVPTLPAGAFRRLDDGTYVVDIVDDGELESVVVEPGRQVGTRVEVVGVPRGADVVAL